MKKNKKLIKRIIVVIIFVITICIAIFGIKTIIKQNELKKDYSQAITLQNKKQYDKAIKEFKKLDNYSDSKKQLLKTYYLYGKEEISNNNYEHALELLEKCNNYEDTKELIIDTKYNYAISIKTTNEKKSISILNEISDYKDSKEIIDKYNNEHRFDGTYSDKGSSYQKRYIINGLPSKISVYSYDTRETTYGDDKYSSGYYGFSNLELNCNEDYTICTSEDNNYNRTYIFGNDKVIYKTHNKNPKSWELNYVDMETTLYKISDDTELPKERTKIGSAKPKIGMTADEVKKSSWGSPNKINKSTYEWGTTEQWVYSDNRYIYFKNGKVTSISE